VKLLRKININTLNEGQRKQNEERKYLYDMERRVEKHHK
jgi:hypothetical protein